MRTTHLLTCVALAVPLVSSAQDSVRVLPPGTEVRFTLANRATLTGRALSSSDTGFVIRSGPGLLVVPVSDIRQTELRHSSWRKYGITAGVAGAALGATAAIVFRNAGCQYDGCERPAYVGHGIVFGGVPLFIIGSFTGAFVQRWRPETRTIAIADPSAARERPVEAVGAPLKRTIVGRDCSAAPNGHASIGLVAGGGVTGSGGVVLLCQPRHAFSLEVAYSDLADEDMSTSFTQWFRTAYVVRYSLVGERFLDGPVRAFFSIDRFERHSRDDFGGGGVYSHLKRGIGAGLGIASSFRLRRVLGARTSLGAHLSEGFDPEIGLQIGLERIR